MPKVSIIIPTYNCGHFINKTIQSVVDQTYKDWELIVVDDFSKDSTRRRLEEWQIKDSRIRLIFLDKNSGGPAHPKNVAILQTKGKYIAYLDHDDEWLKNKLEKQITILENDPGIGLISCEALIVDSGGNNIGKATIENIPDHGVIPEILSTDFMYSNSSLVIPKEVIDKLGKRDENPKIGVSEDREFELRVATAGYKFFVIHEQLLKYHYHDGNVSSTNIYNGLCYAEANLKYISLYKKYGMEQFVFKYFAKEYLRIGDIKNARKYWRMVISVKPFNIKSILIYLYLEIFGKMGLILFRYFLLFRINFLYLIGKKSKFTKDQYSARMRFIINK